MDNDHRKEAIVFVPYITAFGGLERLLVDLSNHLYDNKIKHRIICYQCTIDLSAYALNRVVITILPDCHNSVCRLRQLTKYLREISGEVRGKILVVGLQAILHVGIANIKNYGALIIDTPSLFSPEGRRNLFFDRIRTEISRIITKRSLNKASWSAVMTKYIQSEVKRLYNITPIVVRPGIAINNKKRTKRSYLNADVFRILSVSRIEKSKRLDMVLNALEIISSKSTSPLYGRRWIFDIVGTGRDQERIVEIVGKKGWQKKVLFHGHVNNQKLESLFDMAHLFVMPARQGYGLPALESLSRGLPVLLHKESGVSEILGKTPWVEVIGDEDFADGFEKMIENVMDGKLINKPLPEIPSAENWAKEICKSNSWQ